MAYIGKKSLTDNHFYTYPIEGQEYIALVKGTPKGSHFIEQLIPVEFGNFQKTIIVSVSYNDNIPPQISCSDMHGKELLSFVSELDENYRKLRYRVSQNSLVELRFLRGEKGFKLEVVESKARQTHLTGHLCDITIKPNNTSNKLYSAWFYSDDGQYLYTEFSALLIDDFLVVTESCEIANVTLNFDHEKYMSVVCLKQSMEKLAHNLDAQKIGRSFYFLKSKDDRYDFKFETLGTTFRAVAWKSDLQRLGIEIDKLTCDDLIEGALKVTFKKEKNKLYLAIVFSTCTNYEGLITYQRNFMRNQVKHLVFKTQPFDGNHFTIKQPELFAHSVIDYIKQGVMNRVSLYEFRKNNSSSPEWKIKFISSIEPSLNQQGLVDFEGTAAHDWYVYSQEKDSPFGKVYRDLDRYALRNHLVCQIIAKGVAHMVFIPSLLLKLQGIKQICIGTWIRGKARLELLELFIEGQQGLLADTCEIVDADKCTEVLSGQSRISIEELDFDCEENNKADKMVHVYRFISTDKERVFRFRDYNRQLLAISEPESYRYVCKIQVNNHFNNVKEILSAKFRQ